MIIDFIIDAAWTYAQTNEQKSLEAKREQTAKGNQRNQSTVICGKKGKGNVLDQMEALDQKINVRQELIRVTNQQSNLFNRKINANIRNISKLRERSQCIERRICHHDTKIVSKQIATKQIDVLVVI